MKIYFYLFLSINFEEKKNNDKEKNEKDLKAKIDDITKIR